MNGIVNALVSLRLECSFLVQHVDRKQDALARARQCVVVVLEPRFDLPDTFASPGDEQGALVRERVELVGTSTETLPRLRDPF